MMANYTHNEDKDHTNEQPGLLGGSSDSGVSDDSDRESGSESGESDGKTGSELDESEVEGHGRLDCGEERKRRVRRRLWEPRGRRINRTYWTTRSRRKRRDRRWHCSDKD